MPDAYPLVETASLLFGYVVIWGLAIFGFTDVKTNRLWQGVFITAMIFGFFVAVVRVLAWARYANLI